MAARKTQKKKQAAAGAAAPPTRRRVAATTIPELKRSFDRLESEVSSILKLPNTQRVKRFQEVWRRIFGRPVDTGAAAAYLSVKSRGAIGKGTRKAQKGGAASLDYSLRPGIDGAHGSYPPYIAGGFSFYNTINQEGLFKGCGIENSTPKVPVDMGSNKFQAGGGVFSDLVHVITNKPTMTGSPPGPINDLVAYTQGRELGQSPDPSQNQLKLL
jgi:hypothetical protein